MYTGALNDDIPEILFDFIMPLNSLNPGSGKYFDFWWNTKRYSSNGMENNYENSNKA